MTGFMTGWQFVTVRYCWCCQYGYTLVWYWSLDRITELPTHMGSYSLQWLLGSPGSIHRNFRNKKTVFEIAQSMLGKLYFPPKYFRTQLISFLQNLG